MFQQLEELVRASGKLQLTLKMDNDRMAVVVVPQGEGKEAALRQPRCAQVRDGIQNMHCEKKHSQLAFSDTESTKEPIGNQSVGEEAAAKSIQGKQC